MSNTRLEGEALIQFIMLRWDLSREEAIKTIPPQGE